MTTIEELASAKRRIRQLVATGEARELRRRAQLTLSEVAAEIGVAPSAVCRWERGQRRPRGVLAVRYATILRLLSRPDE